MNHLHNHFFYAEQYQEEFVSFLKTVTWSDRNPLNTEMFFLWSMIRSTKPKLFIESGTFKGYSANFICEALKLNHNEAEFITFGYNLENCLPFARTRLKQYPFATVVEGDSRTHLASNPVETRPTAFFIDGPKGKNLPLLFSVINKKFTNIQFIAVHDSQKESGSGNRDYLIKFFGKEYPIMFCDSAFQDKFSYMDKPLIGKSELINWKPYYWNGIKQDSYGTETGYVLPILGKTGTIFSRNIFYLKRYTQFVLYRRLVNKLQQYR